MIAYLFTRSTRGVGFGGWVVAGGAKPAPVMLSDVLYPLAAIPAVCPLKPHFEAVQNFP